MVALTKSLASPLPFGEVCARVMLCSRRVRTRSVIRNDRTTSFWFDNWLGIGPLRDLIEGPLSLHDAALLVRDL